MPLTHPTPYPFRHTFQSPKTGFSCPSEKDVPRWGPIHFYESCSQGDMHVLCPQSMSMSISGCFWCSKMYSSFSSWGFCLGLCISVSFVIMQFYIFVLSVLLAQICESFFNNFRQEFREQRETRKKAF